MNRFACDSLYLSTLSWVTELAVVTDFATTLKKAEKEFSHCSVFLFLLVTLCRDIRKFQTKLC
jgi:hypothetical protein